MKQCEDCGNESDERMYACGKHSGVYVCRGCKCSRCDLEEEHTEEDNFIGVCGECEELIKEDEAWGLYDGEQCHAVCIAEAEDEADFDNWFINR